ncbi:magnesium transporter [Natronorubrum sediminis]|uniref:Magnesium transporter n=1 Tax=Natronorubrum sediminis TaxID=640943 RepID=A0A1H6FPS3_9EURY|nr:magnesium transporter [Natronorubrum sediminis]SEH12200.1 magnesium transporter [Natronorubrum sediminis]
MASRSIDGPIRSITSTAVPTCQPADTRATVLDQLVGRTWESADTIYVLEEGTLIGRLDITTLLRSTDDVPASRLMEIPRAQLRPSTDREHAILLAITEDRDEIPVVDSDGRLIGAVTSQAIIDTMHKAHVEDILLRAGVQKTGRQMLDDSSARVRIAVRSRAPWLLFGLVAGLCLSLISSQFEATIEETIALAFFPPVIAYIADSVGTQSEAIAIRAFAIADVDYGSYVHQELLVGIVLGTMIGILGGVGASVIANSSQIGVVVGLSLFVSSTLATVLASLIPIGFIMLDVDPALGSGPLATALQDAFSIAIYFLFALLLL